MTNFLLYVLYGLIMLTSSWTGNAVLFANGLYTGTMICLTIVIIASWLLRKYPNG